MVEFGSKDHKSAKFDSKIVSQLSSVREYLDSELWGTGSVWKFEVLFDSELWSSELGTELHQIDRNWE